MNSVRSNSLKYRGYTPSSCKEIGIRKIDFLERVLRYKYDLICHSPENKMLRLLFFLSQGITTRLLMSVFNCKVF